MIRQCVHAIASMGVKTAMNCFLANVARGISVRRTHRGHGVMLLESRSAETQGLGGLDEKCWVFDDVKIGCG